MIHQKMFRKLGIDEPPPDGEDGYEMVKTMHEFGLNAFRFVNSTDVTDGPIQSMLNSPEFRMNFAQKIKPSNLPYVPFDRDFVVKVKENTSNADELIQELKGIIHDRADNDDPGFFVSISYSASTEEGGGISDIQWIGFEFVRNQTASLPHVITYDPSSGMDVWYGSQPIEHQIIVPLLLDSDVRKQMGWTPEIPEEVFQDFKSPGAIFRTFQRNILGFVGISDSLRKKHERLRNNLGIRRFLPKTSFGDYFCQTWVLYLYMIRTGTETAAIALEIVNLNCESRKNIVEFLREIVNSDTAREYWKTRRLQRTTGKYTSGTAFYEWLKYSASLPSFAEEYLQEKCSVKATAILIL